MSTLEQYVQPSLFDPNCYIRPIQQLGPHWPSLQRCAMKLRLAYRSAESTPETYARLRFIASQLNSGVFPPSYGADLVLQRHHAMRVKVKRRKFDRRFGREYAELVAAMRDGIDRYEAEERIASLHSMPGVIDGHFHALDAQQEYLIRRAADRVGLALCAQCEDIFDSDDGVHSDTHDGLICEACQDSHIHTADGYCIDMDDIEQAYMDEEEYHNDAPTVYAHLPDSVVRLNMDDAASRTASYIDMDVAESLGMRAHPETGDWGRYGAVGSYHGNSMRSREFFAEPLGASRSNPPLGLELEIVVDPMDVEEILDRLNDADVPAFAESDGSVPDGAEIITAPVLFEHLRDASQDIWDAFDSVPIDSDETCGTHVSINREYLSPLQEVRLFKFLVSGENTALVRAMAKRATIYRPQIDIGGVNHWQNTRYYLGELINADKKRVAGLYRHVPINFKRGCAGNRSTPLAEWRLFAGVNGNDDLLRTLETVHSLMQWTRPTSCTGNSASGRDYLEWLDKNSRDYPFLSAYLKRKEYTLAEGVKLTNQWWA